MSPKKLKPYYPDDTSIDLGDGHRGGRVVPTQFQDSSAYSSTLKIQPRTYSGATCSSVNTNKP